MGHRSSEAGHQRYPIALIDERQPASKNRLADGS
jgi:hypothetical protein